MRDFSKVSPNVWDSDKFWALPDDSCRYLYLYFLTCKHGNSAGCFQLPIKYIAADMKWSEADAKDRLDTVTKAGLVRYDSAKKSIQITNWNEFNAPANALHGLGILEQIKRVASPSLKLKACEELRDAIAKKSFGADRGLAKTLDIFLEQFRNGIATETEKDTQTEKDREKETEKEILTETREKRTPDGACAEGAAPPASKFPELPAVLDRRLETNFLKGAA